LKSLRGGNYSSQLYFFSVDSSFFGVATGLAGAGSFSFFSSGFYIRGIIIFFEKWILPKV
jgi:hypothetical protein